MSLKRRHGDLDLRLANSTYIILVFNWTSVPNLKTFPKSDPEILSCRH